MPRRPARIEGGRGAMRANNAWREQGSEGAREDGSEGAREEGSEGGMKHGE